MDKIAICGRIRSGKDTVADYIALKYGYEKFRFGDGIRNVLQILYPEEMEEGKPRKLFQGVGQALRSVDPNVWVKNTIREIEESEVRKVIVCDLRQPNEYKKLKEEGYFIIRVKASKSIRLQRAMEECDDFDSKDFNHDTESYVDGFDVDLEIINEGTLTNIKHQVNVMLSLMGVVDNE